jgi:trans-L-3-hydroxyproline dehydratase
MLIFEPRGHHDMYGALLVEPDLPGADMAVLFMHNEGYSTMCGHADMYGAILVEPDLPDADMAVLFMHNEGYSTMCGHAVIALGRYAVDEGLVETREPFTTVRIECPCGLVVARVEVTNGRAGAVSFDSVPAFLFAADRELEIAGHGAITFDIAYGGAFYAIADCRQFGLEFGRDSVRDFVAAAVALSEKAAAEIPLAHPDHDDLAFLYGSILTDGEDGPEDRPLRNICVFAGAQVDRSPTGSGVTARLAALHAKGRIGKGEPRIFESIVGSRFTGEVMEMAQIGGMDAIIARVGGKAHYCGRAEFMVEADDPLAAGFLLR